MQGMQRRKLLKHKPQGHNKKRRRRWKQVATQGEQDTQAEVNQGEGGSNKLADLAKSRDQANRKEDEGGGAQCVGKEVGADLKEADLQEDKAQGNQV